MKIKICGMKYPENITEIATLLPDFLGFIFYDKSLRHFKGDIPSLPKSIKKVGVFVDASFEELQEKVAYYKLDIVQLHGEESPEYCALVENKLLKVIKAFKIDNQFNLTLLDNYKNSCSYLLFDTKGNQHGGNGVTFDWRVIEGYTLNKPYFLSGGIGLENAIELTEFLKKDYAKHCCGIDLNSKFETQPGLKQIQTLKDFFQQIKQ
jgi:phosphoribosylanthranilate isomerase